MTSKELLKMLEKHESVCNARFDGINNKLNKLDTRLWGIYGVIIGVAVLEKFSNGNGQVTNVTSSVKASPKKEVGNEETENQLQKT